MVQTSGEAFQLGAVSYPTIYDGFQNHPKYIDGFLAIKRIHYGKPNFCPTPSRILCDCVQIEVHFCEQIVSFVKLFSLCQLRILKFLDTMEHYRLLADALAYQSAVCACERTSPLSAGRAAIRLLDRLSSGAAFRWLKKDRPFWSESQKDVEKSVEKSGVTAVGSLNGTKFGWGQSKLEASMV